MDKIYIKQQRYTCLLISFLLCFEPIVSSFNVLCDIFLNGRMIFKLGIYLIYFVLLILFVFYNFRKVSIMSLIMTFLIIISFSITIIFHPENKRFMWTTLSDILKNPTWIFALFGIIGFFIVQHLKDINQFLKVFEKFSFLSIILMASRYIFSFIYLNSTPEYMTFSYNLLLPTAFLCLMCIKKFKLTRLICAILSTFLIIICGCRGALLGLLFSLIVYIYFFGGLNNKIKFRITFTIFVFGLILVLYYKPILQSISLVLDNMGLESRTINMALSNSLINDSNRSDIQNIAISYINLLGHGLWGNRIVLNGNYPHNLIIELFLDFGLIFGFILIITLFFILIKGLYYSESNISIILCALLSTGIIKLLLSSSYLNPEPSIYVLIGLCVLVITNRKMKKYYSVEI